MDIREIQKEKNEQYEERHVLAVGRAARDRLRGDSAGAVSALFPGCGYLFYWSLKM